MSDADELLKKAGGFFSKVGATLKQTGKQVTGIGRGEVRIELDRTKVAPGEPLRGRIVLSLPEAVEGKRLVVSLLAYQRTIDFQRRDGHRATTANRSSIFRFDQELGAAQTFTSKTVAFELTVPPDALDKQAPVGSHPIADAVRSVASVLGPQAGPIEWSVAARLEIAWGRDLSHDVDIVIAR
jgi:hypothetical protein